MIQIKKGNILDASENIVCHQVNCRGVMGAGLALQIRIRYPEVYEEYSEWCRMMMPSKLLGRCQVVMHSKYRYIANLYAQLNYGRGHCFINYKALKSAFVELLDYAQMYNFSIAIPYGIGCGLAGGDWPTVYDIIQDVFDIYDNDVVIYDFR